MTTIGPDLFDDADLDGRVAEVVRRLSVEGFQAIWSGHEVAVNQLVDGEPRILTVAVQHLLRRGRIELSDEGRVIAVHGLCTRPTRHRIEHVAGAVHTWCALDAIGIPAALAVDARAVTDCLTCGAAVEVTLTGGVPPPGPDVRLWYPERCGRHLVEDFCSGANLFCSAAHLEAWTEGRAVSGTVMTIDEVAEMGRVSWAAAASHLRARTGNGSQPDRTGSC